MSYFRDGIPVPRLMESLPRRGGLPVPFFVAWIDGVPDFRVADEVNVLRAVELQLCWVCGKPRRHRFSFVVGPMSAITGVHSEPPCHEECAHFSAQVCPFLVSPLARRRDANVPEEAAVPEGLEKHNPGVCLVWTCKRYQKERTSTGFLFSLGPAIALRWYVEGRVASRGEAEAGLAGSFEVLLEKCRTKPPGAAAALRKQYARALELLPTS